jgi:hypothetical protein
MTNRGTPEVLLTSVSRLWQVTAAPQQATGIRLLLLPLIHAEKNFKYLNQWTLRQININRQAAKALKAAQNRDRAIPFR